MHRRIPLRLLNLALEQPWLIESSALTMILDVLARDNESIEVVEARLGRKLDNAQTVTNRGGVAIVPIMGPIVRYADTFSEVSGLTSIETFARDFTAAIEDPSIRAVLLNIDSPGGEVNGIAEAANMIRAAAGSKPIVSYVGDQAASGAYWLAVAAPDGLVISTTAKLGSIGAVVAVPDPAQQKSKYLEIVSTQSPNKRPNVATESGRAQLQALADRIAQEFIAEVARFRGVSVDTVATDFGGGAQKIGTDAVDAGMADRIGSMEGLIAEMQKPKMPMRPPMRMTAMENEMAESTILEKIKAILTGGTAEPTAVSAPATETTPEPVAESTLAMKLEVDASQLHTEVELLRENLASATTKLAEFKAAETAAKDAQITAEITTFMTLHGDKLGLSARESVESLLRDSKAGKLDASAFAGRIESLIAALPPVGPAERVKAGGTAVDKHVAEVASGKPPVSPEREATDRLLATGASTSDADWQAKYLRMVATVRGGTNGNA